MIDAVVFNDTSIHQHHGCKRVMENINLFLTKLNIRVIMSSYVDQDWSQDQQVMRAIEKAQLLIVNGEGTIHHDSPAGLRLLKVGALAVKSHKIAILLNCTFQANSPACLEDLQGFSLISVREHYSQKELLEIGLNSIVVPDFTFYEYAAKERMRSGIGFTCSVDLKMSKKILQSMPRTAIYLPIRQSGINQKSGHKSTTKLSVKKLLRAAKNLYYKIQTTRFTVKCFDQQVKYIEEIGTIQLLVTGRFHAACFAIINETPLITTPSNTFKIEGLFYDAGINSERIIPHDNPIQINSLDCNFTEEEIEGIRKYKKFSIKQFSLLENMIKKIVLEIENNEHLYLP